MNKITVTQRGVELQNELKMNLDLSFTPKALRQETPKRYRILLNLNSDKVKELRNQSPSLRTLNSPTTSRYMGSKTRTCSLQTTRSCLPTEDNYQSSPRVREMRNRSLIQRVKAKEKKIEHSIKLNLSNYANPNESNPILNRLNASTLSTKNYMTSSQLVIEQQKQNIIENIQRQQQRIYDKYVISTRKQDLLQEKQKIKYEREVQEQRQLNVQDKARDKFWQNWSSLQSVLSTRSAQFQIDKDREQERLEDFARHRYLKSFLKLPKCAKNYDKNYSEYKSS